MMQAPLHRGERAAPLESKLLFLRIRYVQIQEKVEYTRNFSKTQMKISTHTCEPTAIERHLGALQEPSGAL